MTRPFACVVDASVAVKLFLAEPLSAEATVLFGLMAADPAVMFHVPELLYLECGNIFWKQCQRGNCTPAKAQADLAALRALRLQPTPDADLAGEALAIALGHGTTTYDSSYVALAARHTVPLITADQRLVNRLTGTPYQVVWLGSWTPPP
jgi:predicted nucleic acid-binding protein